MKRNNPDWTQPEMAEIKQAIWATRYEQAILLGAESHGQRAHDARFRAIEIVRADMAGAARRGIAQLIAAACVYVDNEARHAEWLGSDAGKTVHTNIDQAARDSRVRITDHERRRDRYRALDAKVRDHGLPDALGDAFPPIEAIEGSCPHCGFCNTDLRCAGNYAVCGGCSSMLWNEDGSIELRAVTAAERSAAPIEITEYYDAIERLRAAGWQLPAARHDL